MVPSDVKNRLTDALLRVESPPTLWGVRADTRVALAREFRLLRDDLRVVAEWVRSVESPPRKC